MRDARPRRKVAILVDPVGWSGATAEQEVAQHKAWFTELLPQFDLSFYTPRGAEFEEGTDLVVFDFGGMIHGFGGGLADSNSRALIRYAQDHPNCLVLVVSLMSYRDSVLYEMEELGLIDNASNYRWGNEGSDGKPLQQRALHNLLFYDERTGYSSVTDARALGANVDLPEWWLL